MIDHIDFIDWRDGCVELISKKMRSEHKEKEGEKKATILSWRSLLASFDFIYKIINDIENALLLCFTFGPINKNFPVAFLLRFIFRICMLRVDRRSLFASKLVEKYKSFMVSVLKEKMF